MLRADKISYSYSRHQTIIDQLDFALHPGEIVGLPGDSGRGKSTLGYLLSGYYSPHRGTIWCNDELLPKNGYCPVQMIFQHPELAVNPRWKIKKILQEGNENYKPLLHKFGIQPDWLERYPHELSGGELQRITLIRAMTPATKYLIADEMTASLDPATQALLWKNVLNWAKNNEVGILVISHDMHLLNRVSDRIELIFDREFVA